MSSESATRLVVRATSSQHGQQAAQNRSRGRGGLINECGEVEERISAREV